MFLKNGMQSLTFEDKIIVFKTLAISIIVYLSMMIKVPTEIIVKKIQKRLIWPTKPKIKHETIFSDFKNAGLKNVDKKKKLASLQSS